MSMFGSLVQRLTSPVTSPSAPRRRFKSPARFEVQSEPEDEAGCGSGPTRRKSRAAKHLLDKRRAKSRQSPRAGLVVGAPAIDSAAADHTHGVADVARFDLEG